MKKKSFFLFFFVFALVLSACGTSSGMNSAKNSSAEPAREIVFYTWSEYIDPDIYMLFEEETGIKVVEDNFSSNEEMLAKLQKGTQDYAIIVPSDYSVSILKEKGLIAQLAMENIPNLVNLSDEFQKLPYDMGNRYCVPYTWGSTGIGYLAGEVEKPQSWAVFFDDEERAKFSGRITMLDDMREAFAAALIYLGYDVNTSDIAQLREAKNLLESAQADLAGYDSERYDDDLAAETTVIAHGWSGDFLMVQSENPRVAYTVPQEGGVIWVDNLCIPATADSETKMAAEMFIDFLLRPDIGAMLAEYTQNASPNKAAEALLGEDFLSNPAIYPPKDVLKKLQYLHVLEEKTDILYQEMWNEIKSSK